jgi:hypothetical protein
LQGFLVHQQTVVRGHMRSGVVCTKHADQLLATSTKRKERKVKGVTTSRTCVVKRKECLLVEASLALVILARCLVGTDDFVGTDLGLHLRLLSASHLVLSTLWISHLFQRQD